MVVASVPHTLVFNVPLMLTVNMLLYTGGRVAPLTLVVTVPPYIGSWCTSLPLFSVCPSLLCLSVWPFILMPNAPPYTGDHW